MAEFIEVMRQAKRMCEAFSDGHCSECPIGDTKELECGITVTSEMDCEEVERRVMQWAEEHPEPVYPTTADKPVPEHDGCDKCKYEHMSCNDEPCKRCRGNIGEPAPDLWEEG